MFKVLVYYWRLLMTAICFAGFGAGGVFVTLILVPFLHLLPGGEQALHRRTRYVIHKMFRLIMYTAHNTGILRFKVTNGLDLSRATNVLVLSNHPSYIDVVALLAWIPDANCVVKSEHWRNPVFGGAVRAAGYIRNDSPEAVIEGCAKNLKGGDSLIIFPEGKFIRAFE